MREWTRGEVCVVFQDAACTMQWKSEQHPLRRLFAGLVENALYVEVGMCDPKISDYLVALLLDFLHTDGVYKLRDDRGNRLESMTAMLEALESLGEAGAGGKKGNIHRHIGDFALFWSGVYPEGLRRRRGGVNPDGLVDYVGRGKQAYAIASRLFNEDADPPGSVFGRLSSEFELWVHGLGLVRRGWEQRDFEAFDGDPHLLY